MSIISVSSIVVFIKKDIPPITSGTYLIILELTKE